MDNGAIDIDGNFVSKKEHITSYKIFTFKYFNICKLYINIKFCREHYYYIMTQIFKSVKFNSPANFSKELSSYWGL